VSVPESRFEMEYKPPTQDERPLPNSPPMDVIQFAPIIYCLNPMPVSFSPQHEVTLWSRLPRALTTLCSNIPFFQGNSAASTSQRNRSPRNMRSLFGLHFELGCAPSPFARRSTNLIYSRALSFIVEVFEAFKFIHAHHSKSQAPDLVSQVLRMMSPDATLLCSTFAYNCGADGP
jgi:hypothetical protein